MSSNFGSLIIKLIISVLKIVRCSERRRWESSFQKKNLAYYFTAVNACYRKAVNRKQNAYYNVKNTSENRWHLRRTSGPLLSAFHLMLIQVQQKASNSTQLWMLRRLRRNTWTRVAAADDKMDLHTDTRNQCEWLIRHRITAVTSQSH